jgi:hypothetical protein
MAESSPAPGMSRFNEVLRRFDEENSKDPNCVTVDGKEEARELVYARWLTDWVLRLDPRAPEPLRLAARCQHICRWMSPRTAYPMTRTGYLKWRGELKKFHAQKSGEILRQAGYAADVISRVQELNQKQGFPTDPEVQTLEDALCLVFLEHQFDELAAKTDDDKMVNALQKSWKKMSRIARNHALKLKFNERQLSLLKKAQIS